MEGNEDRRVITILLCEPESFVTSQLLNYLMSYFSRTATLNIKKVGDGDFAQYCSRTQPSEMAHY